MGKGKRQIPSRRPWREKRWRGIAAAPGVALGPAYVYRAARAEPPSRHLNGDADPAAEYDRFVSALDAVGADLRAMRDDAPSSVGSALAKIFDAQLLIVGDETIHSEVRGLIMKQRLSAETAFNRVVGKAQRSITKSSDPYLREMSNDIQTVKRRVVNRLLGVPDIPRHALSEPAILLAHTITPADIMSLRRDRVLGIVSETGGQTSHTALLAKSLGIPAVVGVGYDVRMIRPGTTLLVNGYSGVVVVDPHEHTIEFMERRRLRTHAPWPKRLDVLRELPAVTTDGHSIDLMANIDLEGDTDLVNEAGADGVGLYRTEYLFLQRGGYPSEARQRAVYRRVVTKLAGRPLVVRTFDLGADKVSPDAPVEPNPALGLRGLRISLLRPKTLVTQFRALLAASALGPIRVMVPMVCSLEEFVEARRGWKKARAELAAKHIPFDARAWFGLMIETPAAVALADEFAAEADFLSIGSNDLIQYTVAVDRGNPHLGHLSNHWHPALWRQIVRVVEAARKHNTPVAVCGEMASDPLAIPALVGLGLHAVSTHPNSIPKIKLVIRSVSYADCEGLVHKVLGLKTAVAIQSALKDFNRRIVTKDARLHHAKTE